MDCSPSAFQLPQQQLSGHRPLGCPHPDQTRGPLGPTGRSGQTSRSAGDSFTLPQVAQPAVCKGAGAVPQAREPAAATSSKASPAAPSGAQATPPRSRRVGLRQQARPRRCASAGRGARHRRPRPRRRPRLSSAPVRHERQGLAPRAGRIPGRRHSGQAGRAERGPWGRGGPSAPADRAWAADRAGPPPDTRLPGSQRPGPRRPTLPPSRRTPPSRSLPSVLTSRLHSPQPALQLQLGFGAADQRDSLTAALRSATELWAPPSRRPDQQMGGAALPLGFHWMRLSRWAVPWEDGRSQAVLDTVSSS